MLHFNRSLLILSLTGLLLVPACGQSQSTNRLGHCEDQKFDREVARWLHFTIPAIDVDSLKQVQSGMLILDAREPEEYAVSHIPGAISCGYNDFRIDFLDSIDKQIPIVVYCSIGYRSEKIAKKIQDQGFLHVSNLYGSIFEWANRGYPLESASHVETRKLHTYNRMWGRWVRADRSEKVH